MLRVVCLHLTFLQCLQTFDTKPMCNLNILCGSYEFDHSIQTFPIFCSLSFVLVCCAFMMGQKKLKFHKKKMKFETNKLEKKMLIWMSEFSKKKKQPKFYKCIKLSKQFSMYNIFCLKYLLLLAIASRTYKRFYKLSK